MTEEQILLIEDAPKGLAGVRLVTLNRPQRRNALSPELVDALTAAVHDADKDETVRVLVFTGAGEKAFCAGGDLGSGPAADGFLAMHAARGGFTALLNALRHTRLPSVAAVNGAALGGGFGIVLACDFALASTTATLGTPELKRGLFPMMIARLIYEQIPVRAANELVYLGETWAAEKAANVGIINRVAEPAALIDDTLALAARLAAQSPAVLGLGRRAVNRQKDLAFADALAYLHTQLTLNTMTEDAMEGISAFLEKRDPQWKGR
jgi:enoyl-CoA hydratase